MLEKEEKWNAYTHLAGILFAVIAFPFVFINGSFDNHFSLLIASIIYAFSFIFLFTASTVYHFTVDPQKKILWRKIDHISIYYMISGTYVPYMIKYLEFSKAIYFLAIMYFLVIIGSILKIWFTGKYEKASLGLYIFLGWMIVFIGKDFFQNANLLVISMVVAGGIAYMAGVYFYINDSKKYYHSIWHIFVLLGGMFHFSGVLLG